MMKLIDGENLLRVVKLLDTDVLRNSRTASYIFDQILYDIEHSPEVNSVKVIRVTLEFDSDEPSVYIADKVMETADTLTINVHGGVTVTYPKSMIKAFTMYAL